MDQSETHDADHGRYIDLLSQHKERIFAFARILTLNHESDAEEIFQNACMVAWSKFEQYDPSGDFGAWVCRMVYFEAQTLQRAQKRIRYLSEEAIASLADAALPISRELNDRREALVECLRKLGAEDRAMIDARYRHGRRPKEISRLTGRSVKSVYRSLSRVQGLLLRCIERSLRADGSA